MSVSFNRAVLFGNSTYRADITIKADSASVSASEGETGLGITGGAISGDETGGETAGTGGEKAKGGYGLSWLLVLLAIVGVGIIVFVLYRKNKKYKHYGY